ncbi:formylmethanofuran dehydrogenase subunit C [Candidatus Laterigemmans baculatus]|uniref:formylmethanofuran dehydrogenase subunit C n=1 Tax=Candidatus Laterigemmans baculatus TaxID=2770505 RepID=UPI0013DC5BFD|nr:formylmethanofuran dehydrogenase subunit C [Candidatus Laterigemmans baculatus]
MTLTLRLRSTPPTALDVSSLTLERLGPLSTDQIRRLPLRIGCQATDVATWFDVAGRADEKLGFEGDCRRIDGIGTAWAGGELVVEGSAGAQLGRRMSAGIVRVQGSVGALAASGMRGGVIEIAGDAGEALGGPLRGERTGMRGGRVVVQGNAAAATGHRMRRGTILIGGQAGPRCGWEMVAGTIAAGRVDSTDLGFAMRRGTILILAAAISASAATPSAADPPPPVRPPCFTPPTAAPSGFLQLLLDDLARGAGTETAAAIEQRRWDGGWLRSLGDLSRGGLGEVIW